MKICNRCVLPETFPGISFDEKGICNICNHYDSDSSKYDNKTKNDFKDEDELIECLKHHKNKMNHYDVLVSLSGGVDSSFALITIVEKFKLRPLVFHNDFSYSDETAVNNVKKLCKSLDVDYIIWRNDYSFMRKVWKYANEAQIVGMSGCYFCGNIIHLNALEMADKFNIRIIINGLSKGQTWTINDVDRTREVMSQTMRFISKDTDFLTKYLKKSDMLAKQKFYLKKDDLINQVDFNKILIIPFYIFSFYKTDKQLLKKECQARFGWEDPVTTYPARTMNCEMSWINSYCDIKKMGYSTYHEEYSQLIRENEMTRSQAVEDLCMNPPTGLLEQLAEEIDLRID